MTPSNDPSDMRGAIRAFPDGLDAGWAAGAVADEFAAGNLRFGLDAGKLDGVVICGMGGSAIGGDLLRTLVEPEAPVPVVVVRGYELPGWVSERTLVVASSHSGGTEETLSAFEDARKRGARVVVIASGGALLEAAHDSALPHVVFKGGGQPRAALGHSYGVLLRLARALDLLDLPDEAFAEAVALARTLAARYDADASPAHALAETLHDHLPVVYAGVGLLEAVAMRWRTQLHENAKVPAVGNLLPELDHNEIMGFESAPAEIARRMAVVVLRDRDDHAQIARRMDATRALVEGRVGSWTEVETEGEGRLARQLSLVVLGDWVSFWLAVRNGVDPTPVETIQQLKRTLAG